MFHDEMELDIPYKILQIPEYCEREEEEFPVRLPACPARPVQRGVHRRQERQHTGHWNAMERREKASRISLLPKEVACRPSRCSPRLCIRRVTVRTVYMDYVYTAKTYTPPSGKTVFVKTIDLS